MSGTQTPVCTTSSKWPTPADEIEVMMNRMWHTNLKLERTKETACAGRPTSAQRFVYPLRH